MSRRNSLTLSPCNSPECCNFKTSNILSVYYSNSSMQKQAFSLPDSIIYYSTKNPSKPKIYEKLIQSCKYFYNLNPITLLCCLSIYQNPHLPMKTCYYECCNYEIGLNKISTQKIWLTYFLNITTRSMTFEHILNSKLYRCNVKRLTLKKITLTFKEFKFLSTSVERISFKWVEIKYENGNFVEFEKIVQSLPNLIGFCFYFISNVPVLSSESIKNITKMNHLKNLQSFWLYYIPEIFDIKTFSKFLDKNRHIFCELVFNKNISTNYKKLVEKCEKKLKRKPFEKSFILRFIPLNQEFSSSSSSTDD